MKKKLLIDDTTQKRTFATNLRVILAERGMSQNDLALALDLSPEAISRWMRLVSAPTWCSLVTICDVLKVDLTELFKDKKEAEAYEFQLFQSFKRFHKETRGFKTFQTVANM